MGAGGWVREGGCGRVRAAYKTYPTCCSLVGLQPTVIASLPSSLRARRPQAHSKNRGRASPVKLSARSLLPHSS